MKDETTLDRYPEGHEDHEPIKKIAQIWRFPAKWKARQMLESAAEAMREDAESVSEITELDDLLRAECARDLAKACERYLAVYSKLTQ